MRPVTIFTGQWADLTLEEMCRIASEFGYEGLELATWGNHIDPKRAAEDESYVKQVKETLEKYDLKAWAISAHLCGQLVGDVYDKRHNGFAPAKVSDDPKAMRTMGSTGSQIYYSSCRESGNRNNNRFYRFTDMELLVFISTDVRRNDRRRF